jgi:UDP-glucose 4-epimerase
VQDDIECLTKLAFLPNVVGEVINIGPDEEFVTINELANIIADLLNFDLNPVYVADRPQEVKLATCSADKARKMLEYKTQYTLRQGLQEIIEYIQKRGVRRFLYHLDVEIDNDKTPETWKNKMF